VVRLVNLSLRLLSFYALFCSSVFCPRPCPHWLRTWSTAAPVPSSGLSIQGHIRGGSQPITGAHVYLLAANTTSYGDASLSLLKSSATGNSDDLGAYVLSDSNGSFSITGDYTCTTGQQVYLYTLGGDPGAAPIPPPA
jgi:hypothetical protein